MMRIDIAEYWLPALAEKWIIGTLNVQDLTQSVYTLSLVFKHQRNLIPTDHS